MRLRLIKVGSSFNLAGLLLVLTIWLMAYPVMAAGITLWKTTSPDVIKAGEPFTYTIHVLNTTGNQINLTIADTVPAEVGVINPGGGTLTNGVLQWSVPAVDHGRTVEVSFMVVTNRAGELVNADYRATSGPNMSTGTPLTTTVNPNDPANIAITVNPDPIAVGGTTSLTVTVTDAFGNPVTNNTPVALSFDKGSIDGQIPGSTVSGFIQNGQVTKTLAAGAVAGTLHLTATVDGIQAVRQILVNPGPPTSLQVAATPAVIPADGSTTAAISLKIYDSFGNPVSQTPVTITTSLGSLNRSGSTVSLNTGATGLVSATLGGTVAGTARLTVSTGSLIDTSQSVQLVPGPPTRLSLQASPNAIVANGISTSTITLLVLDQYDNRVDTAIPVTITTSLGKLSTGGTTYAQTIFDGQLQVRLTAGTQAGTATIAAQALGLNTATLVSFEPGPPASISLTVNPAAIPADGSSSATLTATVWDSFGNLVKTPIDVNFASEKGTLVPDDRGATSLGVITRTLRSSTVLGTVPLTATAAGLTTPATNSVNFTVGPPAFAEVQVSPASPITAGIPVTLSLTVRDQVGHVVPAAPITLTTGLARVMPSPTGATDQLGQLQRTILSTEAGPDIITAFSGSDALDMSDNAVLFVPDIPAQAVLTANPTQLVADGQTTAIITATLKDQFGNPVAGVSPALTTNLGTLSGTSLTDAAGVTTRTLRSSTNLGLAVISVTALSTVTNTSVNFIAGPPAQASMSAQPVTVTANSLENVTLVITVTDRVGHPIVGQTLAVTSSLGTISGSGATTSQGVLVRTLASTRSGQASVYVAGLSADGNIITFMPGPLDHIQISPYGSSDTAVNQAAGSALTLNAAGYDFYNNPIPNLTFSWSKVSQDGDGIIDNNGIFTGTLVGLVRLKAAAGNKIGISYVNVGPGTPAIATIDAEPDSVLANNTSTSSLTLVVTDRYGNRVRAGEVITVTSSIGTVEGNRATDATGKVYQTIRSAVAGVAVVSVTNLITVTGEKTITFTAGVPRRAVVLAAPTILPANGLAQAAIVITLLDDFGNPVASGYTPVVQVSLGTLSGNGTTDANGVVTRTLTAPVALGVANFTVKYFGIPLSVSGDTVQFKVGPLHHVVVKPDGFVEAPAGQPITFTVQGYDVDNAPLPTGVTYGWDLSFTRSGWGKRDTWFGPKVVFTGFTEGDGIQLTGWADQNSVYYESLVDITVVPGPPVAATVAVNPPLIIANGISPITFTVTNPVDAYGNTVADGTVLTVTVKSNPSTSTGLVSKGEASIVVTASTLAGTYPFSITGAAGELALTGPGELVLLPGPPARAQVISATPASLIADGVSTSTVVLQVQDALDNPVGAGLTPVITATLGTLTGNTPTDSHGLITRTLQAGLGVGEAGLAMSGSAASGQRILFTPGPPVTAQVTVVTSTLVAGGASTGVIFDIRDYWGRPVADGTIITPTLTPARGTFTGLRQASAGRVSQQLTPGTTAGSAIIASPGISLTGDTLITVRPGPAALAEIVAEPALLDVGQSTSLTITITDVYSNVVPASPITITARLGVFNGGSAIFATTSGDAGLITATLAATTAGFETLGVAGPAGPLVVQATSSPILFLPTAPVVVALQPTGPLTVTAGQPLAVTASSQDIYGNAVDTLAPVDYAWWQSAGRNLPGYGTLTPADGHARTVNFKPIKVGLNHLWTTGGITSSQVLTLNVVAGPPATATVAIQPASVPADNDSTYTVTVTGLTDVFGNTVADGTPLTVTVQSVPSIIQSGIVLAGKMSVMLPAGTQAGSHPVNISGQGGTLTLSGQTSITFTPGLPARATVSAASKTLPANGMSTTAVVITIQDSHANLVADGTPITVTTDLGTLTGSSPLVNGQLSRTLRAPLALGAANFMVEAPNGILTVTGDTVDFVPGPPVMAMVTANPAKVLGNGVSTSQLFITIKDGSGFTVPTSKEARLQVARGVVTPTVLTASAGSLTAQFTADTSVGPAGLAVTYDGIPLLTIGDTLELIPGPPYSATITAQPKSLPVGGNQQSTLTVALFDTWGHPVADGTVVTVTTSLGSILSNALPTADGVTMRSLAPGSTIGTAVFTVTTEPAPVGGYLIPAGDSIAITSGTLDHIDLLPAGPTKVTAGNPVLFKAVGYDVLGNPVGSTVFNWRLLPIDGQGNLSTSTGLFTGTMAGLVGIQASQGNIFSPIKDVTIAAGPPVTAVVSANPPNILPGGATSNLTIIARDSYGNLVADGTWLNVTTDRGSITGTSTTQNGALTRQLISDRYYGTATIYVNGWEAAGQKVSFVPKGQVTASPASLYADGTSQTVLTIRLFDSTGSPLADGSNPVVTTNLGVLLGSSPTQGGILTRTLQASTIPGTAEIYVNGLQAEGSVPFLVGPASVAQIKADSQWLLADGVSSTNLTITVQDQYGHVITAAIPLTVTTSRGTLSGPAPTLNGVTSRTLTAAAQAGPATISVAGLTAQGDNRILFITSTVQGGSFEAGDIYNWLAGGVITPTTGAPQSAPVYTATVAGAEIIDSIRVDPLEGTKMARLGATTTAAHQVSEAWLSQPVYVPPGMLTQVSFWYRLLSYDVALGTQGEWDPFEIYVNGREIPPPYGYVYNTAWVNWKLSHPTSPKDTGWQNGILDLSSYAGQVVTLEFRVPNRIKPEDNTWVYLDKVSMLSRSSPSQVTVLLPLIWH